MFILHKLIHFKEVVFVNKIVKLTIKLHFLRNFLFDPIIQTLFEHFNFEDLEI